MIIGNPAIKTENKPNSKDEIYRLSTDEVVRKNKRDKVLTADELEAIRLRMLKHLK